jgi:hypothetical protein
MLGCLIGPKNVVASLSIEQTGQDFNPAIHNRLKKADVNPFRCGRGFLRKVLALFIA